MNLPLSNGWGEKHHLLVKWKYVEADGYENKIDIYVMK
jgi:hypothetical protein